MAMTKAETSAAHRTGPFGRLLDLDLMGRLADLDLMGDRWMRVEETVEDGEVIVRAELAGLDPATDISVTVEDGILRIAGHRELREERTRRGLHRSEFHYGEFSRDLVLPDGADPGKVTATYRDGILEVHVPCATRAPSGVTTVEIARS